jgi:hypothetical protein
MFISPLSCKSRYEKNFLFSLTPMVLHTTPLRTNHTTNGLYDYARNVKAAYISCTVSTKCSSVATDRRITCTDLWMGASYFMTKNVWNFETDAKKSAGTVELFCFATFFYSTLPITYLETKSCKWMTQNQCMKPKTKNLNIKGDFRNVCYSLLVSSINIWIIVEEAWMSYTIDYG